jgi:hypothetical protein
MVRGREESRRREGEKVDLVAGPKEMRWEEEGYSLK